MDLRVVFLKELCSLQHDGGALAVGASRPVAIRLSSMSTGPRDVVGRGLADPTEFVPRCRCDNRVVAASSFDPFVNEYAAAPANIE